MENVTSTSSLNINNVTTWILEDVNMKNDTSLLLILGEIKWHNVLIMFAWVLGGAVVGTIAIPCLKLCLCCVGFATGGVRMGSRAAGYQSAMGNVPAGSSFACAQSTGAKGINYNCLVFMAVIGAIVGGLIGYYEYL